MSTRRTITESKGNLLIVDDTPANLHLLVRMLSQEGYTVRPAPNGMLALQAVKSTLPELILLDIKMPDMDGYELCQALKADERTRHIPVIFISALHEVLDKVKAFSLGAADYIPKPFQLEEVVARIEHQLQLGRLQRQLTEHAQQLQAQNSRLQREVEERQLAESALRESEEKFAKAFRASPSAIAIATLVDGRYIEVNETFLHLTGYARAETIGRTAADLALWVHPEEYIRFQQRLQTDGVVRDLECEYRTRSGVVRAMLLSAEKIDLGGQACVLYVTPDITERKQAEAEVARHSRRLSKFSTNLKHLHRLSTNHYDSVEALFADYLKTGCTILGLSTGIVSRVERQTYTIYAVQSSLPALKPGQTFNLAETYCAKVVSNRQTIAYEQAISMVELQDHPVYQNLRLESYIGTPIFANGGVYGTLNFSSTQARNQAFQDYEWEIIELMAQDLGKAIAAHQIECKRQRAEEELRCSEANLAAAQRIAHVGNWEFKLETGEMTWSKELFRIFGLKPTQSHPSYTELVQMIHADDRLLFQQTIEGAIATGQSYEIDNRILHPDGSIRHIEIRGKAVTNEQTQVVRLLGVIMDITQRKQTEEALKQAKESALREATKSAAANRTKSEFLANMSHELRTPLNAILGFTQLMGRDADLTDVQRDYLDVISRSGEHLLELINDVLQMSKIEAGRVTLNETSFDLYRLLNSLEEMLQLRAETKGLQLLFERDATVPQYVQTDESKLRQVLINLLGNAIKFTQQGSVVLRVKTVDRSAFIASDLTKTARPSILNRSLLTLNNVRAASPQETLTMSLFFEVEDTGPGIAPTELDQLFEPFVQTAAGQNAEQGTGLGLIISQKFVQLMGGEIEVSSCLGEGSIFHFDVQIGLARATDLRCKPPGRQAIGLASNQPSYRILVVEDNAANRALLMELLEVLGFEVRAAENGQVAVTVWQHWSPHLIWMDMRMPVMDGYEATQRIKADPQGGNTTIVALTASAFEEERETILSAGCDDFVRKPFQDETIVEKLNQHLGVEFIYEEPTSSSQTVQSVASPLLSQELLVTMPVAWRQQLYQASKELDARRILQICSQIPQEQAALEDAIATLVKNFRFDILMNITQKTLN